MAIPFNRQEVSRWERLNDNFSIDYRTTIGQGSYGIVYRGYSIINNTLVAIKVIKSTNISVREIETLKALSSLDHPNIMGFYGEIQLGGNIFLILEYCNRGTLTDLIKEGISEIRVLKLFRELVEGMCYMNARQKMHRDLKPDNILIGPENDIKICDFGLSQKTNSIFVTGKMGTPIYAGPEVFLIHDRETQTYSYNCDVWSAGLILYEMLMGQRLFKSVTNYTQLKEQWLFYERGLKKAVLKPSMHPLWEYFINWMMQFDHKRRPTFHQVLENIKLVYNGMHDSLSIFKTQARILDELKMERADCFISFQVAKHQVLVSLCEKFTLEDIRISNEYKYICMFFCLLRYTHFARDFIRALRYKRLRIDNEDLLPNGEQPQIMMFCDRARFPIQHRYDFYNNQLRNTVVTRIKEKYCKRPQSKDIMQSLSEAVEVVENFHKGEQTKDANELKAIFKDVIAKLRKGKDFRTRFNQHQMRLYAHLLVAAQLDDYFPEENFEKTNVEEQMKKLAQIKLAELETLIDNLHDKLE